MIDFAAITSTLVILLITGFIAEINVGQIVGSVAAARAGAKQSWAFLAGTIASPPPWPTRSSGH